MELINHPKHYINHPSNVEAIDVVRTMSFNLGNSFKYIFRRNDKGKPIEDLSKALWYVNDELIARQTWKYTIVSRIVMPFYALIRQDKAAKYWKRSLLIEKIVRWEPEPLIGEIYRLLHEADYEFFDTRKLELVRDKLLFYIDKYKAMKNIESDV